MKLALSFTLLLCLLLQSSCVSETSSKANQIRIAKTIEKIPASQIRLFLYSLDPHDVSRFEGKLPENSAKSFHWMPVLGSIEIIPLTEKTNLLEALANGVRENQNFSFACFDPRHGLRITTESTTNDFVICFECRSVEAYGFPPANVFLISGSPAATFNKYLDEYKIRKTE